MRQSHRPWAAGRPATGDGEGGNDDFTAGPRVTNAEMIARFEGWKRRRGHQRGRASGNDRLAAQRIESPRTPITTSTTARPRVAVTA